MTTIISGSGTTSLAGVTDIDGTAKSDFITDNDLSFDLTAGNNFFCTPTGSGTITFTNHTSGQSGYIKLVNGSNYTMSAAATTKMTAADLLKVSSTGTYIISYLSDGTNTFCTASSNLA